MKSPDDSMKKKIICVYGIAAYGKGEVDHVGGIAKTAIWQEIADGVLLADAEEMVAFLEKKFQDNSEPKYVIEQIHQKELEMAWAKACCCQLQTIKASSSFQVLVITLGKKSFLAAPWICNCDQCMNYYG